MEDVLVQERASVGFAESFATKARRNLQNWIELAYQFRKWERTEIALGNPSQATMSEHKRSLSLALKATRLMVSIASDPESFDSEMFSKLSILQEQLQHSWDIFYNRPNQEEAAKNEALLTELFPG